MRTNSADDGAAYRLWPSTDLMIGIGSRMEFADHVPLAVSSRRPESPVRASISILSEMRRFTPDAPVIADAQAGNARTARSGARRLATQNQRTPFRDPRGLGVGACGSRIQKVSAADGLPECPCARCCRINAIVTDELSQGRLRLLVRLSGLRTTHFHYLRLSGHARLGLSHRTRRQVAHHGTGRWSR